MKALVVTAHQTCEALRRSAGSFARRVSAEKADASSEAEPYR
jgi:hypothetical protein